MLRCARPQIFLFLTGVLLFNSKAWAIADYYQILRIPANASAHDVEEAYHRVIRKHHPRIKPGDPTEAEIFKVATEAYQTLSVAKRRHNYDQAIESGELQLSSSTTYDPQAGWTVDFDFKAIGQQVLQELARQKDKSLEEQIQVTLELLAQKVDLPTGHYNNLTALKQRAEVAREIWINAGNRQNQWPLEIVEATFKAGFIFIKKFQKIAPPIFTQYWQMGRASATAFELTQSAMRNREYSAIMIRVLEFAHLYQKADCTSILDTTEALP